MYYLLTIFTTSDITGINPISAGSLWLKLHNFSTIQWFKHCELIIYYCNYSENYNKLTFLP